MSVPRVADAAVTFALRIAFALAFVIVTSAPAWAQRTDVVTLANGDRITGEIMELDRGRLEFKTDDAGTISFEWDKIARVEAARQFEVSTSDGRRFLGSLGRTSDRSVLIDIGTATVTLAMIEVVTITPIGASLWSRLDGSVDVGFSYTRSSDIAQFNLNSDTVFHRPAFVLQLTTSATLIETSDDERDDRGSVDFSYVRYIGRRWFGSGVSRFESNESLGLELRSQVGGWVGLRKVNTNRARLEFGGGLVVNHEDGVDTEATENVEALFGFQTSYYTYDRPKTNVDVSVDYYPSLSDWGRRRLQVSAAVKRELFKDFFVALNAYDTFDSKPPSPGAARNDFGVVFSLGWSY